MSLKSGVNDEGTGSGVHASSVLSVLDVLQSEFASVIPMLVVLVLSYERDSSLGVVGIKLWHIKIVNEVDQLVLAYWSICSTCLLFKRLFENGLKKHRVSVVVKVNDLLNE